MENKLIETYHSLTLGALKKCHITSTHPDFEDYLQQARIELLLTHRLYEKEPTNRPPFRPFVFQKICWTTLDKLRKEQRRYDRESYDDTLFETLFDETIETHYLIATDTYHKLILELTDAEKKFLDDRFFYQLTISEIAKKHHVSRQTVYRWRDGVRKKYKKL